MSTALRAEVSRTRVDFELHSLKPSKRSIPRHRGYVPVRSCLRAVPQTFPLVGVDEFGFRQPRPRRLSESVVTVSELSSKPFNFVSQTYDPYSSDNPNKPHSYSIRPSHGHSKSGNHRRSKSTMAVPVRPTSPVSAWQYEHHRPIMTPSTIYSQRRGTLRRRHASDDLRAEGEWEWVPDDDFENTRSDDYEHGQRYTHRPISGHRRTQSDLTYSKSPRSHPRQALHPVETNSPHSHRNVQHSPMTTAYLDLATSYPPYTHSPFTYTAPLPSSPSGLYLHPELSLMSSLIYSIVLSPSTARSRLDDTYGSSSHHSRTLLASAAMSGASRIFIHLGHGHTKGPGGALAAWMRRWGPMELRRSQKDITVFDLLSVLHRYFHNPLAPDEVSALSADSKEYLKRARDGRLWVEGQAGKQGEAWKVAVGKVRDFVVDLKNGGREKESPSPAVSLLRLDVLVGYTVFAGLKVIGCRDDQKYGATVDLDLRLASAPGY